MSKIRVAVLRGGPSEEYSISLRTGEAILSALDTTLFDPLDVVITRDNEWLHNGRTRYPEHILQVVDVVFIALHGTYGEDGTVQRLLERFSIPYTGSSPYASRIAIHKGHTKDHLKNKLENARFKYPPHVIISRDSERTHGYVSANIANLLGSEYILKPVTSGSSIGISVVTSTATLFEEIEKLLKQYQEIIVEKYIRGREVTCGVVERYRGQELYAFPPVEIIPPTGAQFFDTASRYDGSSAQVCPSQFDCETKHCIEESAKEIHSTLGLSQYSRSDFIVAHDGVYFLEVNTLPGFARESLLPRAISAVGGSCQEFVTHLLLDTLRTKSSIYA